MHLYEFNAWVLYVVATTMADTTAAKHGENAPSILH